MRLCDIQDCERIHQARGLCIMHYKRYRKWGDPFVVKRKGTRAFTKKVKVKELKIRTCQEEGCNADLTYTYYNTRYCKDCSYFRAEYSRAKSKSSEKNKAAKKLRNIAYRKTQRAKDLKQIYNQKYKWKLKQKRLPPGTKEEFVARKRKRKIKIMHFITRYDDAYIREHEQDWWKLIAIKDLTY